MKYLLLLVVVAIAVWMLSTKARLGRRRDVDAADGAKAPAPATPQAMLQCAHCGLHLPKADALADGARAYCSDAHRRLGPGSAPQ